jgi:hypothetical protein
MDGEQALVILGILLGAGAFVGMVFLGCVLSRWIFRVNRIVALLEKLAGVSPDTETGAIRASEPKPQG